MADIRSNPVKINVTEKMLAIDIPKDDSESSQIVKYCS